MAVLVANYIVSDPEAFVTIFDQFQVVREQHGATGHRLLRDKHDRMHFIVTIDFPSEAAARSFADDPRRADALAKATVTDDTAVATEELEIRGAR